MKGSVEQTVYNTVILCNRNKFTIHILYTLTAEQSFFHIGRNQHDKKYYNKRTQTKTMYTRRSKLGLLLPPCKKKRNNKKERKMSLPCLATWNNMPATTGTQRTCNKFDGNRTIKSRTLGDWRGADVPNHPQVNPSWNPWPPIQGGRQYRNAFPLYSGSAGPCGLNRTWGGEKKIYVKKEVPKDAPAKSLRRNRGWPCTQCQKSFVNVRPWMNEWPFIPIHIMWRTGK